MEVFTTLYRKMDVCCHQILMFQNKAVLWNCGLSPEDLCAYATISLAVVLEEKDGMLMMTFYLAIGCRGFAHLVNVTPVNWNKNEQN